MIRILVGKRKKCNIVKNAVTVILVCFLLCLPRNLFNVPYSTVVTDSNGELLGARIAADGQWRFPAPDSVPQKYTDCVIAFEDRYFKYHLGVNPLSIIRATVQNTKNRRIVSGGSTITMQTVRLSRRQQRTVFEKIIEMILALRIECHYSKSEIMALYATHAPFGGNVVGLEAASWRYFGHSSEQLSWAEAAMLAVLPNSPAMVHLSKNRNALFEKRNKLLKYLLDKKKITDTDYELAITENLPTEPLPLPQTAPHLVSYFYLKNNGLRTKTTINKNLQEQVENILSRRNSEFMKSDVRNIAALVIDIHTNNVIAYCGNVNFENKNSGNQVDIIRSPRSTGSILKPFLYYATLHEGDILPNTLLPDIPLNINGFSPQNFNMRHEGAVPASKVISRSLNVPSVYLLRKYGVHKFYYLLREAHYKTLTKQPSHYGLSLILGGAEATLWDIAFSYSDMARSLLNFDKIEGSVIEGEKREKSVGVFEKGAVWQVFNALKDVNRPEEIDWRYISSVRPVAWKTGTSYGFRDAWAVGATSRYVVGVWAGNANGEGKPEIIGARTAGPVMFDIFNLLPAAQWFELPYNEFVEAEVCRQSGYLKSRFCDEIDTIMILPQGLKTESCPYHINVNLTSDERYRVYENCLADNQTLIGKSWFVLPPAWEWYYKQYHPEYKTLPPFFPGCIADSETPLSFIYPQKNAKIYLPKQLDGREGVVTFELAHSKSNATVFWHLDADYLGMTQDFHKFTFRPSAGKHSVTVIDNEGNSLSIGITVE